MILSKKSLSRRTVLRGMGASLSLPLLDCMVPALTAIENTPPIPRDCDVSVCVHADGKFD